MKTLLLGSMFVVAAYGTALAQATDYYIVQDATTKKCTIVSQKPTTQTSVVVGDGRVYATRSEAENAIKTVKVCSQ